MKISVDRLAVSEVLAIATEIRVAAEAVVKFTVLLVFGDDVSGGAS
jgi:hypothetical protein